MEDTQSTFKSIGDAVVEMHDGISPKLTWHEKHAKKEDVMAAFLAENPEHKSGRYILKCSICGEVEIDQEVEDYYEAAYNWAKETASYEIRARYVYGSREFEFTVGVDEPVKQYICPKCLKDVKAKSFKDMLEKTNGLTFKDVRELSGDMTAPPVFDDAVFDSKVSLNDLHTIIDRKGLYLYGGVGSGKTARIHGLLFVIHAYKGATDARSEQYKVAMYDMATFMRNIRDFKKLDDFIHETSKVPILILDDFGTENGSDYEMASFYEVINYRWEQNKATIFTSNLALKDWMERNGDNGTRIGSRIASMTKQIKIDGNDRRVN